MTVIARLKIHLPLQNRSTEKMLIAWQKCLFILFHIQLTSRYILVNSFRMAAWNNAVLSGTSTFFKCQPDFKGQLAAFHCRTIWTPSTNPPCGPFPCRYPHRRPLDVRKIVFVCSKNSQHLQFCTIALLLTFDSSPCVFFMVMSNKPCLFSTWTSHF